MVDFSKIYKLLNDKNVSDSTANAGSASSYAQNSESISVFSDDNSNPYSTSQLDDEEFLWWEKRLEEKREEKLDDSSSENIPDGWESITSEKSKALGFLWETGSYTFETSSGVKISTQDIDNIEIYENKETGEVVVINANGATITSNSNDAKISVYNSVIDKIDTSKGNDEVNIYKSEVDKIDTGRGVDTINIEDSTVNKVNSGSGNDTVNVSDSTISNTNTSSNFLWGVFDSAEDTVTINDSSLGKIKTGRGEDNVIANNSTIDVLNTGSGSDSVSINQTDVAKNKGAKKDTVVQDNNYIDIGTETILNIDAQGIIQLDESNSIATKEYINYLLNQEVGFETEEEYQQYVLQAITSNLNTMKSVFSNQEDSDGWVSDKYNWLKEATGLGITDKDIEDMLAKQEAIVQGLTDAINGNSDMTFEQAYEYYTGTTYSKEKIDKYMETANIYSAIMVGCQYDEDYLDKFEEATGKSVEDVTKEYALCQLDTFGKSTGLEDLVEKYSEDQETYADKLSSILSTAGIVCTLACFVFPPAAPVLKPLGTALSLGGMFIDNAIDLVDDATNKDGLNKEELGNIALETGVELISFKAGRVIGKLTNGLNNIVSSKVTQAGAGKVTSYIAGQAAETVTDTALSLGADYAIAQGQSLIVTGEFMDSGDYWSLDRFLGEGKNQLIGILTGLSSAKVEAYQQSAIKTAQAMILDGDTEGAKTYLKKSGVKMNDTSFEGLVKNVQEVDAMMKNFGLDELFEAETQKPVETDEVEGKNPFAIEDTDFDITKTFGADVDYSKMTYEEKLKILEDNNVIDSGDTAKAEIAMKLLENGVNINYIKDFAETPDNTQLKRALELAEKGIETDSYFTELVTTLDNTQFEKALKLAKNGIKSCGVIEELVTTLDNTQFEKALKLAKNGIKSCGVIEELVTTLDNAQFKKALKIAKTGVESVDVIKNLVTRLDDTQFKRALKLAENGIDADHIANLAIKLNNTQIKRALELVDKGVKVYIIPDVIDLNDTQIERVKDLANKGVISSDLKYFATLDEVQYEKVLELANRNIYSKTIKDIITLDKEPYERALKLIDSGIEQYYVKDLAISLDDAQFERALKLGNAIYDSSDIKFWATNLDDTQVETVLKYMKDMGIDGDRAVGMVYKGIDLFSQMDLVEVPKEAQTDMFKNFFANNSNSDEIIRNTDFSQFGEEGIPLEYSRSQFLTDLSAELTKLPTETQAEITQKLGIEVIQDENGNITGYNGFIDLTKLSSDGVEGQVLELANHFILNNKVTTGDSETDNALNSLIQGMPEFINIIGKQQHSTHSYSLDTHILETYKAAISDSDYENLSNYQKFELKLMTILHDISKDENAVDDNHPLVSAKYAKDILSRYSLSNDIQFDIVNNILNHHWGKDYNTEAVSPETTAVQMGTVSNYDIQKIFAKADLIGMGNSEFSTGKLNGLSDSSQEKLVSTLDKAKETTPLVYTSALVKPDLIPSQEITLPDGTTKTIRSFNFAELPDDYDMEEFGFLPGTKASDVTLGVHTAGSMSQFKLFEVLTSDPIASSPQSVSIVSKFTNALYKRFGIAINLRASDVINATHYDQCCGTSKNGNQLIRLATGDEHYASWREIIPEKIQERLGITQTEYSELASIVEDYKWLTQIKDSQEITIGEKTFTGSEIKTAISTAQAELMQMATDRVAAQDSIHSRGDITELVVKRAEVIDNTYILRYNSVDDINNENIPVAEREALSTFLADIPENSNIIFIGYEGRLYSSLANQWSERKKTNTEE